MNDPRFSSHNVICLIRNINGQGCVILRKQRTVCCFMSCLFISTHTYITIPDQRLPKLALYPPWFLIRRYAAAALWHSTSVFVVSSKTAYFIPVSQHLIRSSCIISNDSLRGATDRYIGGIVLLFYSQDHRRSNTAGNAWNDLKKNHISLHLNLVLKIRFMFL